jgi:hypothetical protein
MNYNGKILPLDGLRKMRSRSTRFGKVVNGIGRKDELTRRCPRRYCAAYFVAVGQRKGWPHIY